MIKTHQLEHVFLLKFSGSKITHSKSVARCVAIIDIFFIINSVTFYNLIDQNNTSKLTRLHQSFKKISGSMLPNPLASLWLISGLGSSTVDQVLKYPKYIPSTSTGQVLIFF